MSTRLVSFALRRGPRVARWLALLLLLLALGLAAVIRGRAPGHASAARRAAFAATRLNPVLQHAQQARRDAARADLAQRQAALTGAGGRADARDALDAGIGDAIVPAWIGTRYSFSGQSRTPHRGTVACGHWITAILEDAGLQVEPDLGQYASARIVRTLAGADQTTWLRDRAPGDVVRDVRGAGDGLYLLGLDTHVGLLRVRGRTVDFCHAAGSWPRAVLCEPAATSPSLRSRVHVWGPILSDATVDAWMAGDPIPTSP